MDVTSVGAHFLLASMALLVYIGLGNFLYVGRVLPLLADLGLQSHYTLHPRRRRAQIDSYLALIDRVGHRPWWATYLRHSRMVGMAVGVLMASAVARMLVSIGP
jgi:hypothetical protein